MTTAAGPRLGRFAVGLSALTVLALAIRLAAGLAHHAMVPEYAAYYTTVAEEFARGHGLTVPYTWSYLTPAVANGLALPRPAFDVWLPMASFAAAPFVALFGGDGASRLAGALAGAALVPLTAMLARRAALSLGRAARDADVLALVAAALVALSQPLVTGSISSDSQALFGVTVLAGALAVGRALETGHRRDLVLAGLVLGAGMLTRNETVFLLAGMLLLAGRAGFARAAAVAGIAAVCYAPWALRQWLVFGTPMPGQTAANAFSLSPLDIFGWSAPAPSLATYLAAGPAALLDQRVTAFGHNLFDVLIGPALPWSVVGLLGVALLWRARPMRLLIVTAVAIFAADTLVFPVATMFGTFLHGSSPVLALLAMGAAEVAWRVASAGARFDAARELLTARAACGVAAAITVGILLVNTVTGAQEYASWANGVPGRYAALAEGLATAGLGDAVVIASHPAWTWRVAGHAAVVLPDEDAASVLSLAKFYGATVVAVDGADGPWPDAAAATQCLTPIDLPADAAPLTAFRVVCTGP
jgi:hypothetical protein